jgi:hypothetical protein
LNIGILVKGFEGAVQFDRNGELHANNRGIFPRSSHIGLPAARPGGAESAGCVVSAAPGAKKSHNTRSGRKP